MPDLETVDLEGVEILEADVRIHGKGSPPEGDIYSTEDLHGMAAAAQELEAAGEWRIPVKIGGEPLGRTKLGHEKQQILLSSGELPAAGWLSNQRVSDDGKKLLADIKHVPKLLSQLIGAHAYRTRSSELSSVKSQTTGKAYPWVVTGLAWLGGKMPAVRTLRDVASLYETGGETFEIEPRFLALENSETSLPDELVEAVVEMARVYVDQATGVAEPPPDSRPEMPADRKYTDEQVKAFAEATGLETDKVTDELLAAAGVVAETDDGGDGDGDDSGDDAARSLEAQELRRELDAVKAEVEDGKRELHEERKTAFVTKALSEGRVPPAARAKLEAMYDKDPDGTREFLAELPKDDNLGREYGANGEGDDEGSGDPETDEKAAMRLYEEAQESMRREEGALL